MNKKETIETIFTELEGKGLKMSKKDITTVIDEFETVVKETIIAGGEINLTGFMKIYSADVAEKTGKSPSTGAPYVSPAHKTVKIKAGKTLKDILK